MGGCGSVLCGYQPKPVAVTALCADGTSLECRTIHEESLVADIQYELSSSLSRDQLHHLAPTHDIESVLDLYETSWFWFVLLHPSDLSVELSPWTRVKQILQELEQCHPGKPPSNLLIQTRLEQRRTEPCIPHQCACDVLDAVRMELGGPPGSWSRINIPDSSSLPAPESNGCATDGDANSNTHEWAE